SLTPFPYTTLFRSLNLFFLAYTNIKDNYSSKNTNNSYNTKWENISLHYDYSSLYLYSMYCNKQTNAILLDISFSLKYLYLSSLSFSISVINLNNFIMKKSL